MVKGKNLGSMNALSKCYSILYVNKMNTSLTSNVCLL